MGEARLAADREREWPPDRGDAVRGLYGRATEGEGPHDGEIGEVGFGSVLRRIVGGFLTISRSNGGIAFELLLRSREGTGEDLNASMRSVSGTGSIRYRELHAGQGGQPLPGEC